MSRSLHNIQLLLLVVVLSASCGVEGDSAPVLCPPGEDLSRWIAIYSRGKVAFPCPTQMRAQLEPYGAAWIHVPANLYRSGNTTVSASVRLSCSRYLVRASIGLTTQTLYSTTDRYSITAHAISPYTVAIGVEVQDGCAVTIDQVTLVFGDVVPQ